MPGARSQQVRTASELTLIADIKPGFVEGMVEPLTYASRLRALLTTLFRLRKAAEEQGAGTYVGPLERLRVLQFVRYAIFDDDRRILLAVSFDHSWESYMRGLVYNAGPLLDAIFCHTTDYAGHTCSRGFGPFTEWVKAKQIPVDFHYAAEPGLTVDDLRYLKEYAKLAPGDPRAAFLNVGDYDSIEDGEKDPVRALRLLAALRQLDRLFPGESTEHSDRAFYEGTVRALLWGSGHVLEQRVKPKIPKAGALRELWDWYQKIEAPQRQPLPQQPPALERANIQGNILSGYTDVTHACLLLVQCDSPAAMSQLFARLKITYDRDDANHGLKVNLALTARGLRTLGLSEVDRAAFPAEFLEGMEQRAGLLGDVAEHHPERWQRPTINWPMDEEGEYDSDAPGAPIPLSTVDAAVLLYTRHEGAEDDDRLGRAHPLRGDVDGLRDLEAAGVRILRVETMRRTPYPGGSGGELIEAFGFRDGISKPIPRAGAGDDRGDAIAPGELVMGYPDKDGEVQRHAPEGDPQRDLFHNGSFLVIRKLAQDVDAFRALEARAAVELGLGTGQADKERAAALIMGRHKDGRPLVPPNGPGPNDFDYAQDADGQSCPFHAHIRRANPRRPDEVDGFRHSNPRIARRSVPYREPTASGRDEHGLVFMAFNARIAEQYEVIQSWLNGANITGLPSLANDPLTGVAHPDRPPYRAWVAGQLRSFQAPATSPVSLKWGMYLFVPGRDFIERFKAAPETAGSAIDLHALEQAGEQLITAFGRVPPEQARTAWKRVLENPAPADRRAARALWAAIRKRGGSLMTPYGLLVGDAEHAERVLRDHETFSVREYYDRMRTSVGPMHLGMDPLPKPIECSRTERDVVYESEVDASSYARTSSYNDEMYRRTRAEAYEDARAFVQRRLAALAGEYRALIAGTPAPIAEIPVDLRELAFDVMEHLSKEWFGLPDGLRDHFWAISLDTFRPHPEPWVREQARKAGEAIRAAFAEKFREPEAARDRIAAVLGFTGPTTGTFMSVMSFWDATDQLGRLKQWWDRQTEEFDPENRKSVLYRQLIAAMQQAPVPDLLYRTALRPGEIGAQAYGCGDRIVVSLASASAQKPERSDLLFGGDYHRKAETGLTHACPGQPLAIGVLLGMIATLLEQPRPRFIGQLTLGVGLPPQAARAAAAPRAPRSPAPSRGAPDEG